MLKRHVDSPPQPTLQLPPVSDDVVLLPQPESILERRVVQKGLYRPKTELLVKWVGLPAEEATWENAWRLAKTYPQFFP